MRSALRVEPALLPSAEAVAPIGEHNHELAVMYPEEGANHFHLTLEQVRPGQGCFGVAYLEELFSVCMAKTLAPRSANEAPA